MPRLPDPILVLDLFPVERAALLELLRSLDPSAWEQPTVCPGWAVRDIAAHLVADDFGRLSRTRDGYRPDRRRNGEELVAFIDRQNAEWVEAMRRISSTVLVTLLELGGQETQQYFETLDPFATGGPVVWATGDAPAPVWLDLARELTERWHHQQQIRDAVGAPSLIQPRLFRPVLATFAHALPRTLRDAGYPRGTAVTVTVTGESGGEWSILHGPDGWRLYAGGSESAIANLELTQDDFWRLVTKGITPVIAETRSRLSGELDLARQLLKTVAIIG